MKKSLVFCNFTKLLKDILENMFLVYGHWKRCRTGKVYMIHIQKTQSVYDVRTKTKRQYIEFVYGTNTKIGSVKWLFSKMRIFKIQKIIIIK